MAEWWEQLLSFGAVGRVEDANEEYRRLFTRAKALSEKVERRRAEVSVVLGQLVEVKTESLPSLRRISRIAKNLSTKERAYLPEVAGEESPEVSLARVQVTVDAGYTAMNAAKGLAAGASTAIGAWGLVGTFGAASTGTAISGLSGVAATNATLAWFGGGSMAAGGAGMAGGAAVIGGVVALPMLAVMGFLAHSKANKEITKIEVESAKLDQAMDEMNKLRLVIDIAEKRATELTGVIGKAREAFEFQLERTHARLYPRGWLSRAWRWLRKTVGAGYFRPTEVHDVQKLLQSAAEFAAILDQKVFDENGVVQRGAR